MIPRLLLDTHVLIQWLIDSRRLSREQAKALEGAVKRGEPVAFSAITLLEIAVLESRGKLAFKTGLNNFFDDVQGDPVFRLIPLSYEVALEAAAVAALKDPADRTIVATARVHGLRLLTSDQRIIDSKLVPVID